MEEEKIIIDYDMIIAAKSGSMQALGYILDRHSDYINRVHLSLNMRSLHHGWTIRILI
jgi:hypothetical protein